MPLELLAVGGMARVVAANRVGLAGFEKLVALKLILPEYASDEAYVTMFLDEARMASRIQHPNVVAVLDVGRDEVTGILYMAMELVLGATLADVLRAHPAGIPAHVALETIAQAADGLDAAHRATAADGSALKIVHRDVSPANLLMGLDGFVRVTDFGVARAAQRQTRTETGKFKGKLAYCSPEHVTGAPLDHRSDIFALGIVAFELLTHLRLFQRRNPSKTLEAVLEGEIPSVAELRKDVPPAAAAAIDSALCRDMDGRPEAAVMIAERIREAARSAGLEDPSAGLRQVALTSVSDQVARLAGLDPNRKRSRPPPSDRAPDPRTLADRPANLDTIVDFDLIESE